MNWCNLNNFLSCHKSWSNHRKSTNDGATIVGRTTIHDFIIISIDFGKFTSIYTKRQKNSMVEDGSTNSRKKGH
jgi:hypothetical protein